MVGQYTFDPVKVVMKKNVLNWYKGRSEKKIGMEGGAG